MNMEKKTLVIIVIIAVAAIAYILYRLIVGKGIFAVVSVSGVTVTLSNSNPIGSVTIPVTAGAQTQISITFSISNAVPNSAYTINFASNKNFTLSTDSTGSGSLTLTYYVNLCSGAYLPLIFNISGPSISNKNNNQFTLIVYLQG